MEKADFSISLETIRNDAFLKLANLDAVARQNVISRQLPAKLFDVKRSFHGEVVENGLRLHYVSRISPLQRTIAIKHRFFFPNNQELREQAFVLTPEQPEATSEILLLLLSEKNDYCSACVYDSDNCLLAVDTLVFNRNGQLFQFRMQPKHISTLPLDQARLFATRSECGKRALKFEVSLQKPEAATSMFLFWQTHGIVLKQEYSCSPEQPLVSSELELEQNDMLVPGEWSVIAMDAQERFVAQAYFTIQAMK